MHCCHRDFDTSLSQEFIRFLLCYFVGEEPYTQTVMWHSHDPEMTGTFRMEFHLRCFGGGRELAGSHPDNKIFCRRYQSLDIGINIAERRRSAILLSPFHQSTNNLETAGDYVILRMLDDRWDAAESKVPNSLHLCQPWTSISMFQHVLYRDLGWWAESWREALHIIEGLVSFEVCKRPE